MQEIIKAKSNFFLIIVFIAISLGVLILFSSSYYYAKENFGASHYFILRQGIYFFLGGGIMVLTSRVSFDFWYRHSQKIFLFAVFLLLLTFIPGLSAQIKGSRRWIRLLGMSFLPAEFFKIALPLASYAFFEYGKKMHPRKILIYFCGLTLSFFLFLKQPDFSSLVIVSVLLFFTAYLSRLKRRYLYSLLFILLVLIVTFLFAEPYRIKRLLTYFSPWEDPQGRGFQIVQSFIAFSRGGLVGRGLGNSFGKLFYLPESYNDFIFSILGEELGLIGVLLLIIIFLFLVISGFSLAQEIKHRKYSFIIYIVSFYIALQAFLNMSVVLGLIPTTGINLPFISYGGSSILMNCWGVGLVLSAKNTYTRFVKKIGVPLNEA